MLAESLAALRDQEGFIPYVYDDANDNKVVPGYTLVGHPTVGIGRALDVDGLSMAEATYLFSNDIAATEARLAVAAPWWNDLTPLRRDVITNMAFNIGIVGMLSFHGMISALKNADYGNAAAEMNASKWASEVPNRVKALRFAMINNRWGSVDDIASFA